MIQLNFSTVRCENVAPADAAGWDFLRTAAAVVVRVKVTMRDLRGEGVGVGGGGGRGAM